MPVKTAELTGAALDYWVAKALGDEPGAAYSADWSHGGPLIERERIQVVTPRPGYWSAVVGERGMFSQYGGPTPLIAAMRALIASKLGEEVPEVPTGNTWA